MEPVFDADGVLWVNDSKATNVAATRSALASLDRPVVLLLGGKDKGEDFAELAPAAGAVHHVLAYGAAGARAAAELRAALGEGSSTATELLEGPLEGVVARARQVARPGDVVLLSPACSSYDMYESYEHRGRHFASLARGSA
jgi:UDP-N-acetylmuramoylalanine--D-glutamate ligase